MIVGRGQPYTRSVVQRLHAWALAPFPVAEAEPLPTTADCGCEDDGGVDIPPEDRAYEAWRAAACGCDAPEPVRIVAALPEWRPIPPAVDPDADARLDWATFLDLDDVGQDP